MFQLKKTQWTVTSASYGTVWLRSVSWWAWIRIQGLCKPRHLRYLFFEQLLGGRLLAKIFFALNSQHQIKAIIIDSKYLPTYCTIHQNQLLTKFGTNFVIWNQWCQKCSDRCRLLNQWRRSDVKSACTSLQIIEPMTSKWCQKCSPLKIIEPLTKTTWGWGCVNYFWWAEKQRAHFLL